MNEIFSQGQNLEHATSQNDQSLDNREQNHSLVDLEIFGGQLILFVPLHVLVLDEIIGLVLGLLDFQLQMRQVFICYSILNVEDLSHLDAEPVPNFGILSQPVRCGGLHAELIFASYMSRNKVHMSVCVITYSH